MDRQVLLRKIMSIGDEIHRLQQDLIALQSIDIVNYPENYSGLSQQISGKSEIITRRLRELVYCTNNIDWPDLLAGAAVDIGIAVDCDINGIVEMTIPCMMPHKRKNLTAYITAPLYTALERFVLVDESSEGYVKPYERFKHCVICITHVYDRTLYGKGRKRDHDNKEIKGIVDVINTFLLTDDNESLCDIFNTSELSDRDSTRISIMKKDMFPNWVQRYKNQP